MLSIFVPFLFHKCCGSGSGPYLLPNPYACVSSMVADPAGFNSDPREKPRSGSIDILLVYRCLDLDPPFEKKYQSRILPNFDLMKFTSNVWHKSQFFRGILNIDSTGFYQIFKHGSDSDLILKAVPDPTKTPRSGSSTLVFFSWIYTSHSSPVYTPWKVPL